MPMGKTPHHCPSAPGIHDGQEMHKSENPVDVTIFGQLNRSFLQRVSIACYAERCISYDRFCLTVCLSHPGIMPKRLQLHHAVFTGG